MSNQQRNSAMFVLSLVLGVSTMTGTLLLVGSLKGEIVTTIAEHGRKIDSHDQEIKLLTKGVTQLETYTRGLQSQAGQIPGKVVSRLQETK